MHFRGDERGQAIQVGAVLLFGALIIAFSTYQAFVVPDQNRKIEFDHNQQVQQNLQDLRNALVSTGGSERAVTVPLGVRYPNRIIAINPGPAGGTLRTVGTTTPIVNASIRNATTDGETGDFWDGSDHNYTTGTLVYSPDYNLYTRAPQTVYENTVLFNQYRERTLSITGQRLISDRRINLVALNGTLSVTRSGAVSVDVQSLSSSSQVVSVTNTSAESNVTLTVPTRYNASVWRELLTNERVANGGHVYNVTTEPLPNTEFSRLLVRLESGVQYRLQMTRVGVGTGTTVPDQAYLTSVSGNGSAVPEDSSQQLVVEVRDEFNNPVSGVSVRAGTTRSDSSLQPNSATTGSDGRVTYTYEAPSISGDPKPDEVNASFTVDPNQTTFDPEAVENVQFSLEIQNTDGSGLGGSGGGGPYDVFWQNPGGQSGVTCPSWPDGVCEVSSGSIDLTMDTNPTADGATVQYSVNNSTVGTVNPSSDTTNSRGENTTTFSAGGDGGVKVYTSSGGSGDIIELLVDIPGLRWQTGADWDNANSEDGVVHEGFGDHSADEIQLGYPSTDTYSAYWDAHEPVSYFPMDEDSGSTVNDVIDDDDGSASATVGATGMLGTTSYFFGNSEYVDLGTGTSGEINGGSYTMTAWVRDPSGGDEDSIFDTDEGEDEGEILYTDNSGELIFEDWDDGFSRPTGVFLDDGSWHHVAMVWRDRGNRIRIYVDGTMEEEINYRGNEDAIVSSSNVLGIGYDAWDAATVTGYYTWQHDGRIDEARVYAEELTSGEISNLYQANRDGSLTTVGKSAANPLDVTNLELTNVDATLNGDDITVTVESDADGDGTYGETAGQTSDPINLDGSGGPYTVSGLSGDSTDFRLVIELDDGDNDPTTSPVFSSATLQEG